MNQAYLVTGGNMGNRTVNLFTAKQLIGKSCGEIIHSSSLYETEAWGNPNQETFLNQAVCISTLYSASDLLIELLSIEERMGRIRKEKYGPRIIDIDIIFFNHDVIRENKLQIPHPEMQHRLFVLLPLSEIAPDYIHPVSGYSVNELLLRCNDTLTVKKFLPA